MLLAWTPKFVGITYLSKSGGKKSDSGQKGSSVNKATGLCNVSFDPLEAF